VSFVEPSVLIKIKELHGNLLSVPSIAYYTQFLKIRMIPKKMGSTYQIKILFSLFCGFSNIFSQYVLKINRLKEAVTNESLYLKS